MAAHRCGVVIAAAALSLFLEPSWPTIELRGLHRIKRRLTWFYFVLLYNTIYMHV